MLVNPQYPLKPHAEWQVSDPTQSQLRQQGVTMQCCHCGKHWNFVPGSGRQRGFCYHCMQITCGPACPSLLSPYALRENLDCLPWEKWFDLQEAETKPWQYGNK